MMAAVMLASIVWYAPAWLAGLAAVAVPLLVHLWSRHTGPSIAFPSIRLLLDARRRTHRFTRWREPLVLALRCAIVALIALTFALPHWQAGQVEAAPTDPGLTGRRVTIVLDASASMARDEAGRSLFDLARQRALALVETSVGQGAAVNVVIAGHDAQALLPTPTTQAAALREGLSGSVPSVAFVDLRPILEREAERSAVVHLVTDAQRTSIGVERVTELPTNVRVHRVGSDPSANLSLHRPRIELARSGLRDGVQLTVDLTNHGGEPRATTVNITQAGVTQVRTVEAAPGQSTAVSVRLASPVNSSQLVRVSLPDDLFALDNAIEFGLTPIPPPRVVLLTGAGVGNAEHAAWFIARAVSPEPAMGPVLVVRDDNDASELPEAAVWLIGDEAKLTATARAQLTERARAGAGLIWFGASPGLIEGSRAGDPLSPARLVGVAGVIEAGDEPMTLRFAVEADWLDRTLGRASLAELTETFVRPGEALGEAPAAAQVWARWSDQSPALIEHQVGRGRVLSVWVDPDPAAGDLVRHPSFAPFVHEAINRVSPQRSPVTWVTAGRASWLKLASGAPSSLMLLGPGDVTVPVTVVGEGESKRALIDSLPTPGAYRLVDADRPHETVASISATIDPRESELTTVDVSDGLMPLDAALTMAGESAIASGQREAPSPDAQPLPLWPWLAVAALLVAGVESVASNRWPNLTALRSTGSTAKPTNRRAA